MSRTLHPSQVSPGVSQRAGGGTSSSSSTSFHPEPEWQDGSLPNTFSVSALGQGRATPCLLQGAQTHSTAWFNHLTGPPAPSPVPVPSFSSVLTQARRGRADHPVGRAASTTAEAQTGGDASSEQCVIFSLHSGLATKAVALLSK